MSNKFCIIKPLKVFLIVVCFSVCFAQNSLEISYESYFTPQEVLEYFSVDNETKRVVFSLTHPYIAPDWFLTLRMHLNHDSFDDRLDKGAKRVNFKEPLLIHSAIRLDESLLAEVMPIIEVNSRKSAENRLARFKISMKHLEESNYSVAEYNLQKNHIMEQYHNGDPDTLYKRGLSSTIASVYKQYRDYYLLPTFYS